MEICHPQKSPRIFLCKTLNIRNAAASDRNRHDTMIDNFSFETKEVSWSVDDMVVLGTMTRPKTKEAIPGVVLVAGSGPVDRNWCSPLLPGTNGSARLLAEALSRRGYATLRYDKRASGPHASENMPKMLGKISMQSHIDELEGAFETLATTSGLEPTNIFALTSSEGAIHALNYQLQSIDKKFKGLVLTGAPGRSIGQVARSQADALLSSLLEGDTIMKHYDDAISAFLEGKRVVPDTSLPEQLRNLLIGLDSPANLPFTRELWSYNLSDAIAKVSEPIIVIIGKKDIQTDWDADGKALEIASEMNGNVTFVYPENADHTLKHEERPIEQLTAEVVLRYNAEDRKLDQETLLAIVNWLNEHRI